MRKWLMLWHWQDWWQNTNLEKIFLDVKGRLSALCAVSPEGYVREENLTAMKTLRSVLRPSSVIASGARQSKERVIDLLSLLRSARKDVLLQI